VSAFLPPAFDNLPHARPVQIDLPRNLAVAHAVLAHGKNIGMKLGFVGIAQIAFS
jgi:hypothetical protein